MFVGVLLFAVVLIEHLSGVGSIHRVVFVLLR